MLISAGSLPFDEIGEWLVDAIGLDVATAI
jgi:hypothetical protein